MVVKITTINPDKARESHSVKINSIKSSLQAIKLIQFALVTAKQQKKYKDLPYKIRALKISSFLFVF